MNEFSCEAQDLAVGYGKAPLAEHIALGVRPGQILTLIGPNGAGKSTLLKTLAGQLAPMGGAVLLDGQDLTAYTRSARAQRPAQLPGAMVSGASMPPVSGTFSRAAAAQKLGTPAAMAVG